MASDTPFTRSAAEVSCEEARDALRHLLGDPEFKATERNRRFIEFVCEERLEGRSGSIKAYSIAVDVFGRSENFDPSTDPIVRIEATRLRGSLTRYYELEGRSCKIRIDLPKGGYVPSFCRQLRAGGVPDVQGSAPEKTIPATAAGSADLDAALGGPSAPAAEPAGPEPGPVDGRRRPYGVLMTSVVATCALALILYDAFPRQVPIVSANPVASLSVRASDPALAAQADRFQDALITAMSQFQNVRIASGDPVVPEGEQTARHSTYRIVIKYAATDIDAGAWWQLVDAATGVTVQSGVERAFVNAHSAAEVQAKLVGAVAVELVASRGAITTAETASELASPSLGYGCVLRGALALRSPGTVSLADSRACLEATVAAQPNDAAARSMLALVLLHIDSPEAPTILSPNALILAGEAVTLDPRSDRAASALMVSRFRNGQVEAAVMAGRRAMELNPNNGAIPAKLGSMLFALGRWDEGLRMVARAQEIDGAPYPEADITRAMDAYRRADYPGALLLVRQMGDLDCFTAQVLRVATLGQLGLVAEAKAAAAQLKQSRRDFERDYRLAMTVRHAGRAMTDNLQAGLIKAGLQMR